MTGDEMRQMAGELVRIAERYQLMVESCAENIDLQDEGIVHGSCIDQKLIERIGGCRLSGVKDRNQRTACGCMESVDVGAYNTCRNEIRFSIEKENHRRNVSSACLTGAEAANEKE